MSFSNFQQDKLNFYSKYNLAKQQQDIFSLYTLIDNTDDYISYLEHATLTLSIEKDETNQYQQFFPISSLNKRPQTKKTQRILSLTDEEKNNKFKEMEQKLYKLQKLEKRFHEKLAKLQQERKRKKQLKQQRKKNQRKMKSQLINIVQSQSSCPRIDKQQKIKKAVQIQGKVHIYQQYEDFDSYYDEMPEVRIVESIKIDGQQNRKRLREMLQKKKLNQNECQINQRRVKQQKLSEMTQCLEEKLNTEGALNKISSKSNIVNKNSIEVQVECPEVMSKQKKENEDVKLARQKSSHLDESTPLNKQAKVNEYNPFQQIIIKINDLEIQTQIIPNKQNGSDGDQQIQKYPARKIISIEEPQKCEEPHLQQHLLNGNNQNNLTFNQLQSPIVQIPTKQSYLDQILHFTMSNEQTETPNSHNSLFLKKNNSLQDSDCKGQIIKKEPKQTKTSVELTNQKMFKQEPKIQNKQNAVPKFSISTTLNQHIKTFSINGQPDTKTISQPTSSPQIVSEKPKKLNFKKALQTGKTSKMSLQNKKFVAVQQSHNRKQSKNALFLNFFKQN